MIKKTKEKKREKSVPKYKLKLVDSLADKIKKSNTVLVASTRGLPTSQFQKIKKNLRGKAEVFVTKKTIVLRAIETAKKGNLKELEKYIGDSVALFISEIDTFELSALLSDSLSPTKARDGDIASEDIRIEAGPTDLMPGPAISELSGVGLKVAVEGGKIAIKTGFVVVKKGEAINEKVAGVLGKLNVTPMKVGFIPIAAYDSKDNKVYSEITIDKAGTLESLRKAISKALGFAVSLNYPAKETVKYFIMKARREEMALEKIAGNKGEVK